MAAKKKPDDDTSFVPKHVREARAARAKREAAEARAANPAPPLIKKPPVDLRSVTNEDIESILVAQLVFDARRLYREDGTPISLQEVDDVTALALSGIEVDELFEPGENRGDPRINIGIAKKFKVSDRIRAAELVLKYRGALEGGKPKGTDRLQDVIDAMKAGPVKKKSE